MTLADDFTNQYLGKSVETEDPTNRNQCMDWAFAWCDKLGIPRTAIRHLYAYQVFTEPTDTTRQYFTLVANTPTGVPPPGALVVFSNALGVAGHIALALTGSTTSKLLTSDQNWNFKPIIQKVTHDYSYVLGWLILKINRGGSMTAEERKRNYEIVLEREPENSNPDPRTAQQFIDAAVPELTAKRQARAHHLGDLTAQIQGQQAQIDVLESASKQLENQLAEAKEAASKPAPLPQPPASGLADYSLGQLISAVFKKLANIK